MPVEREALQLYYREIFPYAAFHKWLSYGSDDVFSKREFSFTLAGDIYARYQSFETAEDWKKGMVQIVPEKMDIGAVYNAKPKLKDSVGVFTPTARELIFDIDISDYDDVRFCCKGAGICDDCWPLMAAVGRTVDSLMRRAFGFKHLLWVFSGRRGVHCWVSDPAARALTDEARTAVAHYVSVWGGVMPDGRVRLTCESDLRSRKAALHPSIDAVYHDVLVKAFKEMYVNVDGSNPNSITREPVAAAMLKCLTSFISDATGGGEEGRGGAVDGDVKKLLFNARDALSNANLDGPTKFDRVYQEKSFTKTPLWKGAAAALVLSFVYPRLDVNVSTHRNHLLKAPFVVHPGTGKICVPIDFTRMGDFSPSQCVTLSHVLRDLEHRRSATAVVKCMQQPVEVMEKFASACEAAAKVEGG